MNQQPKKSTAADRFLKAPVYERDVVFLGDSLTEEGQWSEYFPRLKVANRGIGGDTIAGVSQRLDQVAGLKPKKIFLLIGINDLIGGIEAGRFSREYRALLLKIKTEIPSARLIVQSLLPVNTQIFFMLDNSSIERVNAEIRKIAEEENLEFVDLFKVLAGPGGELPREYTVDGLHLTGNGYEKWSGAVAAAAEKDR